MALMGWATHVLQWRNNKGKQLGNHEPILKVRLSSDCSLELGSMKPESLVIVDENATVNTFTGLVHTARQAMEVGLTRKQLLNLRSGAVYGWVDDWG